MYERVTFEVGRCVAVWALFSTASLAACQAATALDAPSDGTPSTDRARNAPDAEPPSTQMRDESLDAGAMGSEEPTSDANPSPTAASPERVEWLGECVALECTSRAGGAPVGLCIPILSCARSDSELECQRATEANCGDGAVPVFPLAQSEEPPPPDPTVGCAFIQFCNARAVDGSEDEERCIQTGCSVDESKLECQTELRVVCGNVAPPYVLITLDGERLEFGS